MKRGEGTVASQKLAKEWNSKAFHMGHKQAIQNAVEKCIHLAKNGELDARLLLYTWYSEGKYVEKNLQKANYYLELAAIQGEHTAQV